MMKTTPFERYMLKDDRETHSMTFTIRLEFSGVFDREAFVAIDRVNLGDVGLTVAVE